MTQRRPIPPMPSIKEMLETTDGRTALLIIAASVIAGIVSGVLRLQVAGLPGVKLLVLAPSIYLLHAISRPYATNKRQQRITAILILVATPLIAFEFLH